MKCMRALNNTLTGDVTVKAQLGKCVEECTSPVGIWVLYRLFLEQTIAKEMLYSAF